MDKLQIFQKSYDFTLWIYPIINRIPKSHRQVLGRKIEQFSLDMLFYVVQANKARGKKREELQIKISDNLDYLRISLRLLKDSKFISIKQYTAGAEKINEIARMLNSWMNHK